MGVKSVGKSVLELTGHVLKMGVERLTKGTTLACWASRYSMRIPIITIKNINKVNILPNECTATYLED